MLCLDAMASAEPAETKMPSLKFRQQSRFCFLIAKEEKTLEKKKEKKSGQAEELPELQTSARRNLFARVRGCQKFAPRWSRKQH